MANLTYYTSYQVQQLEQDLLPDLTPTGDPIFDLFVEEKIEAANCIWQQYENFYGAMQVRGLNGTPLPAQLPGLQEFNIPPIAFGEYIPLDERRVTEMRNPGSANAPIDLRSLQAVVQGQLITRDFARRRIMAWELAQTGACTTVDRYGVVAQNVQYVPQTYTAPLPWSNFASSTPLNDMRQMTFMGRGTSAKFDNTTTLLLNKTQLFYLFNNQNPNDLFGKKDTYGASYLDQTNINRIMIGEGLPNIQVFDDGFYDDAGVYNLYLATGKGIVIGKRPGNAPVGSFLMTRCVNNDGFAPGVYTQVVTKGIESTGAWTIEHHRGWNGTPVVKFPRAIGVLNC